jgi:hypothetical protein
LLQLWTSTMKWRIVLLRDVEWFGFRLWWSIWKEVVSTTFWNAINSIHSLNSKFDGSFGMYGKNPNVFLVPIHIRRPTSSYHFWDINWIVVQVLKGLNKMHSMHRIHRDIKSDNILLTSEGGVKIGTLKKKEIFNLRNG